MITRGRGDDRQARRTRRKSWRDETSRYAFEVTAEDTKLIDLKQGPFPATDAQDRVRL